MLEFLWNLHQQNRLRDLDTKASIQQGRLESTQTGLQQKIDELERRADALTLTNMALWSLVKDKLGLTDEQLSAAFNAADMQDGVMDGRISKQPKACSLCGRTVSPRFSHCIYCGQSAR